MKKVTKRFARFWYPGLMFGESTDQEIGDKDINSLKFPEHAYAFQIIERQDVVEGTKVYKGEEKVSGFYYHADSKVETIEELKRNPKASEILISNMKNNKWDKIVWSRFGNWPQNFTKNDVVLKRVKRAR